MIVYRDILSGDEMITDAFKLLPVMDKEGNKVMVFVQFLHANFLARHFVSHVVINSALCFEIVV